MSTAVSESEAGGGTGAAGFFAAPPSSDNPPPATFNTSAADAGAWFTEASACACAVARSWETWFVDMTSIRCVPVRPTRASVAPHDARTHELSNDVCRQLSSTFHFDSAARGRLSCRFEFVMKTLMTPTALNPDLGDMARLVTS